MLLLCVSLFLVATKPLVVVLVLVLLIQMLLLLLSGVLLLLLFLQQPHPLLQRKIQMVLLSASASLLPQHCFKYFTGTFLAQFYCGRRECVQVKFSLPPFTAAVGDELKTPSPPSFFPPLRLELPPPTNVAEKRRKNDEIHQNLKKHFQDKLDLSLS